jgi:hypothetical protein
MGSWIGARYGGQVTYGIRMERIRIEQHSFMGTVWIAAWLHPNGRK